MANIDLKKGGGGAEGRWGEEWGGLFRCCCLFEGCHWSKVKEKRDGWGGEIDMSIKMHEIRTLR